MMKKIAPYLIMLLLIVNIKFAFSQFVYINPLPNSKNHMPEVTIALNPGGDVLKSSIGKEGLFTIAGSKSGRHEFDPILSTDGHTIILKPRVPFANDEGVTVTVADGIMLNDGREVKGTSFSFTTRKALTAEQEAGLKNSGGMDSEDPEYQNTIRSGDNQKKLTPGTPPFTITVNNNPAPGSFFFANELSDVTLPAYLTIMDNDTITQFSRQNNRRGNDFKMNDNNLFTYYDDTSFSWIMLDSSFNAIDTFQCGNGYAAFTDRHEFRIYPDGHALIEAADKQYVDMSQYVPGGNTNAQVIGFTLQRLDAARNVVFEWRSWDHFQFTDAVSQISLTAGIIDWVHGNSMDEYPDGSILVSFRHLCEITKINGTTGDIVWRMGGENNQFTFMNDISATPFYFQHYVRRLPNGHILLFNNNNYQTPLESSAKEYAVNEVSHAANLVWHYTHPATNGFYVYGRAGGSAQRLSNGNTVISWGLITATASNPNFTEVDPSGNIVYEFKYNDPNEVIYRTTKHLWEACDKPAYVHVTKLTSNSAKLSWNDTHGSVEYELGYKITGAVTYKKKYPDKLFMKLNNLAAGTSYTAYVKSVCDYSLVRKSPQLNVNFTTQAKLSDSHLPEPSLSIYPNPADNQVSLAFTNAGSAPVNIRIINLVGETVYEDHLFPSGDQYIFNLDIQSLPPGLYMCEAENSSQKILQKLVKQ
jgi:hypothetical protein